jgi:hypothetical protein
MPRRAEIAVREPDPDAVYGSKLVAQVVKGALPTPETVQAVQALRRIAAKT